MDPPPLKLIFLKGPREGETLEYKVGSTIRMGRIVRGNDIAVKDEGVSSKHLRIWSGSGKWTIMDLGSSNGTFVNSAAIPADTPFDLGHGDTIKLGESTTMAVDLALEIEDHKLPPRPRRNNRRQAAADPDSVGSVQEIPTWRGRRSKQINENTKENDNGQEIPRRGRVSRSKVVEDTAEEARVLEKKDENKVNFRVTRSRKIGVADNSFIDLEKDDKEKEDTEGMRQKLEVLERKGVKKVSSRDRRGKNIKIAENSCLDPEKDEKEKEETEDMREKVEVLEEKGVKKVSSRARKGRKIEIAENACLDTEKMEPKNNRKMMELLEDKNEEKMNSRVTRSRKNRNSEYLCLDYENLGIKDTANGETSIVTNSKETEITQNSHLGSEKVEIEPKNRRGRKKKLEEGARNRTLLEDVGNPKDLKLGEEDHKENGKQTDHGIEEASKKADDDDKCDKEKGSSSSSAKNYDGFDVDLEKMTLGEWFDFLEEYLPKQMIDETEKIIEEMRIKAQRVHEYIAEQKKAKGKVPV